YQELVGLELHAGQDNELPGDRWLDGRHFACSWHEGAFMHFALYQAKGTPTTGVQLGFMASDLQERHAAAVARGVRVEHAPRHEPWGLTARYWDPDGNSVGLTQTG
ncbi:MAG TPA: VOC family protein, partial [Chloroflexota bacterium]|nr:VOC family protein [Chloroflexota bacterium]